MLSTTRRDRYHNKQMISEPDPRQGVFRKDDSVILTSVKRKRELMDPVSINRLLQKIEQGEESALLTLHEHFASAVYSLAYRVLGNTQDAEEITQDVFLRIWDRAEAYDPARGTFLTWIMTITRRMAIDRIRHRERRLPADGSISMDAQPALHETLENGELSETGRTLLLVLENLPEEQSAAIQLAFFQGMSHSEIADYLHKPLGTIKSQIRLGMQKLRSIWLGQEIEAD
jgi:RNA polymerase sigma-70 factor (ECF subfamily)